MKRLHASVAALRPLSTSQLRTMSFNGHAWISSLRYGFPFGPQLGSFVHQYCSDKDGSHQAHASSTHKDGGTAASSHESESRSANDEPANNRTIVLDDTSQDAEMRSFAYDRSPCYAGNGYIDAKAAKLVMQRRHDAADALHCKRTAKGTEAETAADNCFQPTLTFDLLRQIREMYRLEMISQASEDGLAKGEGGADTETSTDGSSGRDYLSSSLAGTSRATSALDEVFLDDAAIYARALVYVSGGSRLARDWIAGCAAVSTNHPSLITIAMQHQGTHEDLEDFARYCEIVGHADDNDCSLLPESKLCERRIESSGHKAVDISGTLISYNASSARCGTCDGVIIDLPVPLSPQRQADIIKRCMLYDAMTALHFMEHDAELLDLSRIRAAATYMNVPSQLVEQLREVVLAEHSLVAEKHSTIDAPPAMAGVEASGRGPHH